MSVPALVSPSAFAFAAFERSRPGWREESHYASLLAMLDEGTELCWLCGCAHNEMAPKRLRINSGFTNHGWAQEPRSSSLCLPCCVTLMGHPDNRHFWRNNGHVFTLDEPWLVHPRRFEWRDVLLNPPNPPFLICIPTSYQKHLIFRGGIGVSREVYPVQFEECGICVNRSWLAKGLEVVEALLRHGFSCAEIKTGRVNSRKVLRAGVSVWRRLDEKVQPLRGTRMFELLLHVAKKEVDYVRVCN